MFHGKVNRFVSSRKAIVALVVTIFPLLRWCQDGNSCLRCSSMNCYCDCTYFCILHSSWKNAKSVQIWDCPSYYIIWPSELITATFSVSNICLLFILLDKKKHSHVQLFFYSGKFYSFLIRYFLGKNYLLNKKFFRAW